MAYLFARASRGRLVWRRPWPARGAARPRADPVEAPTSISPAPAAVSTVRVGSPGARPRRRSPSRSRSTWRRCCRRRASRTPPEAAAQALAIAIRTYALFNAGRHQRDGFDLCDTTHCQVLRGELRGVAARGARHRWARCSPIRARPPTSITPRRAAATPSGRRTSGRGCRCRISTRSTTTCTATTRPGRSSGRSTRSATRWRGPACAGRRLDDVVVETRDGVGPRRARRAAGARARVDEQQRLPPRARLDRAAQHGVHAGPLRRSPHVHRAAATATASGCA